MFNRTKSLTMLITVFLLFSSLIGNSVWASSGKIYTSSKKEKFDPNLNIAVIGAGASGLTAAHFLVKRGYKHVTVFEKESEAGGKVNSINYNGQDYELGAVWVPYNYYTVRHFINLYDVKLFNADEIGILDTSAQEKQTVFQYLTHKYGYGKILAAYTRFALLNMKNKSSATAGFSLALDPDLALPFQEYMEKKGLTAMLEGAQGLVVGCGYGFYEEVPALYIMKFVSNVFESYIPTNLKGMLGTDIRTKYVKGGYQTIWKKVADHLNVIYDAKITKITRNNKTDLTDGSIHVFYREGLRSFDRVIISSSPDATMKYLDLTPEEKDLFSKVETYPYYVTMFYAQGLDAKKIGASILQANSPILYAGHSTIFASPYNNDEDIYMAWQTSLPSISDAQVRADLKEDVAKMGGTYVQTLVEKKWPNYFPHVKSQNLVDQGQGDFYSRLNSLQGKNGTYYVGGLMGFETVELTADFAKKLIEFHFESK